MPAWYIRRAGLVLVAAVVLPFAGSLLLAQPPNFPRPPTGPGGFGPGSGIPNFPNAPAGPGSGLPNFPTPPSSPFDQNNRPGAGNLGGGSRFEWVFTCTNCRKELGRSESAIDKPPYEKCPYCGVTFRNGGHGWSRPGSTFSPNDGTGQQTNTTPPTIPTIPDPNLNLPRPPAFEWNEPDFDDEAEFDGSRAPLGLRILVAVGFLMFGLLVLGGIIIFIIFVSRISSGGSSRQRRRRRRQRDDDDDYEDDRPVSRVRRY